MAAAADLSPWLGGPASCQFDLELNAMFTCFYVPQVQRALVSQLSHLGAAWWGLWVSRQPSPLSSPEKPLGVQHM